jgi:ABC-type bacteriocin/lantibiotic exporter with double-glycine peptidase domain
MRIASTGVITFNCIISAQGGCFISRTDARALFLKKDIYIFDEPTSFLDNNTINKVFNNLKNFFLNKTVIIISHNEDCLKFCNKIYYLRNKKIFLKKNN